MARGATVSTSVKNQREQAQRILKLFGEEGLAVRQRALAGESCDICEETTKHMHVDHCHVTGSVRGILCLHCNVTLGAVKDNILLLTRMIEYLGGAS